MCFIFITCFQVLTCIPWKKSFENISKNLLKMWICSNFNFIIFVTLPLKNYGLFLWTSHCKMFGVNLGNLCERFVNLNIISTCTLNVCLNREVNCINSNSEFWWRNLCYTFFYVHVLACVGYCSKFTPKDKLYNVNLMFCMLASLMSMLTLSDIYSPYVHGFLF